MRDCRDYWQHQIKASWRRQEADLWMVTSVGTELLHRHSSLPSAGDLDGRAVEGFRYGMDLNGTGMLREGESRLRSCLNGAWEDGRREGHWKYR